MSKSWQVLSQVEKVLRVTANFRIDGDLATNGHLDPTEEEWMTHLESDTVGDWKILEDISSKHV